MSKKKKILIAVIIVLFLLLLVLLIWFLNQKNPAASVVVVTNTEVPVNTPKDTNVEVIENNNIEVVKRDGTLQSLAITFAERYGSYSTESSFANLYDVMDLMTASLRSETEKFVASAKNSPDYYGVTTMVLSVKSVTEDENSASLEVSTQRDESFGGPQASEIKYQKLLLNCLKENGVWKVSSATWQ